MANCLANVGHPLGATRENLCPVCRTSLEWLTDPKQTESVPGYYFRLDPTPGSGEPGEGARGKPESRSPANDSVIALTDRRTSGGIANVWSIFHDAATRLGAGEDIRHGPVSVLAPYVHVRLDWVIRTGWCGDFLAALRIAHGQLRTVSGEPRPNVVGHCECGGPLYRATPIRCGRCGNVYDLSEQLRLLA